MATISFSSSMISGIKTAIRARSSSVLA